MAVITQTSLGGSGEREIAVTILGASDTFAYDRSLNQVLVVTNATGAPLNVLLVGGDADTFPVEGYGSVDVSAGYTMAVPDTETWAIPLRTIEKYLVAAGQATGSVTVTGGDDATAFITRT